MLDPTRHSRCRALRFAFAGSFNLPAPMHKQFHHDYHFRGEETEA